MLTQTPDQTQEDSLRFQANAQAILQQAGGSYTLGEAARLLNTTSQKLHAQIVAGEVFGVAFNGRTAVPRAQFDMMQTRPALIPGVPEVLAQFREAQAGDWSAIQYFAAPDPALSGATPRELLAAGDKQTRERVIQAARAYLGLDEGPG